MKDHTKGFKSFLSSCSAFVRRLLSNPETDSGTAVINFTMPEETRQTITRLQEKSGVANTPELFRKALSTFELLINLELRGGSIDLVEPNGVDRNKLELLKYISGDDKFEKEE